MDSLYYECRITIDPVFDDKLYNFNRICKVYGFKVAELFMKKGKEFEVSNLDSFCTGKSKSYHLLKLRMQNLLKNLQKSGFVIRRYKIESALLDSKISDVENIFTKSEIPTAYISGHLDITSEEYEEHYNEKVYHAAVSGHKIVVGDARGTDRQAIMQLRLIARFCKEFKWSNLTIYHMFEKPRVEIYSGSFVGGFQSDEERDAAMTEASDYDIAWVRPGRENSGTARNLERRIKKNENKL